ncbi:MAG: amidohydrolase [Roseburia sp.]|nr:amidohydrolase [Roseburia sp.]
MKKQLLARAKELQPELLEIRRDLHRHPETGFDLTYTKEKVRQELIKMGYEPLECGKAGLVVLVGGKQPGKTMMLRADMDALPMQEEADVDYRSETPGKMHGCGHDMHTTMLLGAAKILKEHEAEIKGTIKLVFQPAEEIFQGSLDMIANGVLENPHVDAAMMIHVIAGMPMPAGMFLIPGGGISAASCEQYHITVTGKGGHGSTPHLAIDPITAAAQIHLALQEINSREIAPGTYNVFTTCKFSAGNTSNVIPNTAEMWGTIRTTDPEEKVGQQIKTRMEEIAKGIGTAMRCDVDVEFYDYCPCMVVDADLSNNAIKYMTELLGPGAQQMPTGGGGGSEDFAFVSHKVPTVGLFMSAGNTKEGYEYNIHNPKLKLDDSVLWAGSAAHAYVAMRWLEEN